MSLLTDRYNVERHVDRGPHSIVGRAHHLSLVMVANEQVDTETRAQHLVTISVTSHSVPADAGVGGATCCTSQCYTVPHSHIERVFSGLLGNDRGLCNRHKLTMVSLSSSLT